MTIIISLKIINWIFIKENKNNIVPTDIHWDSLKFKGNDIKIIIFEKNKILKTFIDYKDISMWETQFSNLIQNQYIIKDYQWNKNCITIIITKNLKGKSKKINWLYEKNIYNNKENINIDINKFVVDSKKY